MFNVVTVTVNAAETQLGGFGSFEVGLSNDQHGVYKEYATQPLDFKPIFFAATQASHHDNEKASVTMQTVVRGVDDWDRDIAWAYVICQPRTDLTRKLDRMSSPFCIYADSKKISISYPCISPSYADYNLPFYIKDGSDALYCKPLGAADIRTHTFVASSNEIADNIFYA